MTHIILMWTAMQSTSQPKTKRLTDYILCGLLLTCTPSKKVLVFVITFFTIICAAWLLHPSQVEKNPFVHDNYYLITTLILPSALTMTFTKPQKIKNSAAANSCAYKHTQKHYIRTKPTLPLLRVPRMWLYVNNVPATSKDPITVSPISKPPNPVSSLLGNDDDSVTNSIKWSSKRVKSPVEVPNDNSGQSSKWLIASKPVLNDKVDSLNKLLIVSSKPTDRSKENDTGMASTDAVSAVATRKYPKSMVLDSRVVVMVIWSINWTTMTTNSFPVFNNVPKTIYYRQHQYFSPGSRPQQNHCSHLEVRSTKVLGFCGSYHQQINLKKSDLLTTLVT